METNVSLIGDIVAGKVNWRLKVRVINLWTVPNRNFPHEINTLEMIFLDEQCSRIQAAVKKQWFPRFFNNLQVGSAYFVEKVLVAQNDSTFKKTNHKYKLNFMGNTVVTATDADEIPMTHFEFCDFPSLLRQTRTDLFADVMGHVIEKSNILEKEINGKHTLLLDIGLEDLSHNKVRCTLWGDYAQQMQAEFETQSPEEPIIVVLQMCRLTKFQGVMGVSTAFHGSRLYINDDITQINDYKSRMEVISDTLTQSVTQRMATPQLSISEEILQTPRKTIAELIEATEVFVGSVMVRVIEIDTEQGFAFNSCNTCFGAASKDGSKFYCGHCDCVVTATPRYKLQVHGIDETGSTKFVLFNQLVTAYVGKSAVDLLRACQQRPNTSDGPIEFNCLLGKQFIFKVQVTDMNIRRGFQTYTVKKLSAEAGVIQQFIQKHAIHGCNDEEDDVFMNALGNMAETYPLVRLGEPDETNKVEDYIDLGETPKAKKMGKRPMVEIDCIDLNNMDLSPESASKMSKTVSNVELGGKYETFIDLEETPKGKKMGKRPIDEIECIDLNNMAFSPEAAVKVIKSVIKVEPKE